MLSVAGMAGLLGGTACGDDDVILRDMQVIEPDLGPPDFGLPDGASRCETAADCDDGVECTREVCDDRGVCVYPVDNAVCDDNIFCNGVEQCDARMGCVPGVPETCNDNDVCTIDRCDEEAKLCRRTSRDFDEDGDPDFFCEGGSDCDDRNPLRGSTVAEVCEDNVDNDCDEMVDESECGAAAYDTCEDPLDISAGGFFEITSLGTVADYEISCAPSGRKDLVATFELTESKNVTLRAEGRSVTYVSLRTECGMRESELECTSGFPGTVRRRSLPAGRYYVLIADLGGDVAIEALFTNPTPPATNETCEAPMDVSAGGNFNGSFVDVTDDVSTTCGSTGQLDLVYRFSTTAEQDVAISVASAAGDSLTFAVRSACDDQNTDRRCIRGAPAASRLHQLPAGDYFLIVEGSSARENDFTLDVSFEAPTPPPAGDTCRNPIPITAPTTVSGTLRDKQDDLDLSCAFSYRDIVYELTVTERSDVTLIANGGGSFMYVGLQRECGDDSTQLRCVSGNPGRNKLRNLAPGTYYVVVESSTGASFDLTVETAPPTMSVPVSGNDQCETAFTVPPTGGLFTGNTSVAINDYGTASCGSGALSPDVAFRLDLDARKRVVASTEGSSFDTVLHMHTGACANNGETACDDDGGEGSTSLITRTLDAGTYFFVVDGFGATRSGDYVFEVSVTDP